MGIHFNGEVTINGNVEIYDNGSMKISSNQIEINLGDLNQFIRNNLTHSPNKDDYLKAVGDLQNSTDKTILIKAYEKIKGMGVELGKSILIHGLSATAITIIKKILE